MDADPLVLEDTDDYDRNVLHHAACRPAADVLTWLLQRLGHKAIAMAGYVILGTEHGLLTPRTEEIRADPSGAAGCVSKPGATSSKIDGGRRRDAHGRSVLLAACEEGGEDCVLAVLR